MNHRLLESMFLLITVVLLGHTSSAAEDFQPVSMSAEAFSRLPVTDQRTLLVRIFERRLEHARNLSYEMQEFASWYEYDYDSGKVGKLLEEGGRHKVRHWLLKHSSRMDIDWPVSPTDSTIDSRVSMGYDAKEGVSRSSMTRKSEAGEKMARGRIDSVQNPGVLSNSCYMYWLEGTYPHKEDYLFRYLLDHQGEFEIKAPVEGDKVQLTVNYQPWWADKPGGKRVFILDPQKGFLPIRGVSRWEAPPSKTHDNWRVEEFVVEESRLVGDVWMPIKLTNKIAGSPVPERIGFFQIVVSRIEHGSVKPADLVVAFTEGTEVVDAIKGVGFIADPRGNPARPLPLSSDSPR